METKILIVEDELQIARFVELELTHEGYQVDKAIDGREGLAMAQTGNYSLMLLDVCLPELNGMEVLRRLRRTSNLPVIMLTARDSVMDKVTGLDSGADDYVTKPFAIEELLARIRLALKKAQQAGLQQNTESGAGENEDFLHNTGNLLKCGEVILNKSSHIVTVCGREVELTNREFKMLQVLMENQNIVLSRDTLLEHVCGYDYVGETNVTDVYIRYLRTKIDDAFGIKLIHTVRGVGYVIK
ncbi:MAG: response regulator transcription factor [Eubacteriales bacterium]|nr:response regulator transcription factor [Eubacteriales bacterium]